MNLRVTTNDPARIERGRDLAERQGDILRKLGACYAKTGETQKAHKAHVGAAEHYQTASTYHAALMASFERG